jgi:hypothetical protein
MKYITYFFLFFLATHSNAWSQDKYVCVSEAIGGVSFNTNSQKWESTKFSNNGEKFILSSRNGEWSIKEFGRKHEDKCGKMQENGHLSCRIIFGDFIFNLETKRFLKTYLSGYVFGEDTNENTPAIIIGTCEKV